MFVGPDEAKHFKNNPYSEKLLNTFLCVSMLSKVSKNWLSWSRDLKKNHFYLHELSSSFYQAHYMIPDFIRSGMYISPMVRNMLIHFLWYHSLLHGNLVLCEEKQ